MQWLDGVVEEVDLELDVLGSRDGSVWVRDQEEFDRVREAWPMPNDVATQAEGTCEPVRGMLAVDAEPFGKVGRAWLSRFLTETQA